MILKLAWKELREHQAILLTMVIMTVFLSYGLTRIAAGDQANANMMGTSLVLGMAAAYGVVCGSMMLAGEHEGGTLMFLDIFFGRRGVLWLGKFLIGIVLVLVESIATALLLRCFDQVPPAWTVTLIGQSPVRGPGQAPAPFGLDTWLLVLPVLTLEAYAWGLLGSSLKRRVLPAAGVAVLAATPVWLVSLSAAPQVALTLRSVAALFVLIASCATFVGASLEAAQAPPTPQKERDAHKRFLELWEAFERRERLQSNSPAPIVIEPTAEVERPPPPLPRRRPFEPQASSPGEVLWWLTLQQARGLFLVLAIAGFLIGLLIPAHVPLLWPFATLMLGVACGTAAFGSEQRDLSYQFLSAQHFPLQAIWRFKTAFWFVAAVMAALSVALGGFVCSLARVQMRLGPPAAGVDVGFRFGFLRELMGPFLFYGVWLVYGFATGQVFVWLCRKNVLAVLISGLVSASVLGFWLSSLLCLGMNGWQLWVPPLIMLATTRWLMRAWAGGRIKERKPLAALIGFATVTALWMGANFGFRAWEIPDVGEPLDPAAFRASLPTSRTNVAGKKIQDALAFRDGQEDPRWLTRMEEMARLPLGVIETPRGDGQMPLLQHVRCCLKMAIELLRLADQQDAGPALDRLVQILALSRNMRNKAALEAYVAGVGTETMAILGLGQWLARQRPDAQLVRRALDELNRHAAETPSALDCLQTECFRSLGMRDNPSLWAFYAAGPRPAGKFPERWLAGSIALSLQMPWEDERKTRLWRLVWAGLFRAVETPHWQLPEWAEDLHTVKEPTGRIVAGWLGATDGRGVPTTPGQLSRLLDASWLSDERLFCSVTRLRAAATRGRWHMDAARQATALCLYKIQEGKPAPNLQDLVPKYLPGGLPTDPYSGQPYHYRLSEGEHIGMIGDVRAGQAILWSTGPDRIDHGGTNHGGDVADDDGLWAEGRFDLINVLP